ncbi:trypsin inhibitor-like [Photinus pyralis]|uniref:trypsin inhibitor-like n=1 Tax=Photinus pyralis TaxID=7054 RepID=UPI00126702C0|nr:trypsin inhibitor-like [Photinus pyralis]
MSRIAILCVAAFLVQAISAEQCGDNESYVQTNGCEPSCRFLVIDFPCAAAPHMACQCDSGFVRRESKGPCIKPEDCPK